MADEPGVPLEDFLLRRAGLSRVGQAYRSAAGMVTKAVSGLIQGGGNAMQAEAFPAMALSGIPVPTDRPPQRTGVSDTLAGIAVPQSLTEAGIMAGTMGAGGLAAKAGVTGLKAAGLRTGGAMLGGELGGQMEGQSTGIGALIGGVQGVTGESLGWGIGKIARSVSGARQKINATEWDAMAGEIGKYVPGLFKAKNPADLKRKVLSGEIQNELGDRYVSKMADVDALIGRNKIEVPTLAANSDTGMAVPMSLEEAAKKLSDLGYAGFGGGKSIPIRRTIAGRPERSEWEVALGEIEQQLDRFNPTGEAKALFGKLRTEYAVGKTLEDILRQPGTWHGGPSVVEVDFNRVREAYEQQLSKFTNMLTPGDIAAVEKLLYRGGPFGGRDLLPSGFGGSADAAGQLFRSGGGTGTVGVLAPRTALPNVGAQYTGQPPRSIGNVPQTALDAALEKASYPFLNELGINPR